MARRRAAPAPAPRHEPSRRARRKARRQAEGTFIWRWRRAWFALALVFVLGVSGVGYAFTQVPLPDEDPELSETSFFCGADVESGCNQDNSIAQLSGGIDRVNVAYADLPQVVIDAVLAAEDRDFFEHKGVDPAGILRAFWANLRNQDIQQGGSTITQQYVKNVYLTHEQTVTRKVKEAALAVKLERELPKQEILLRYLNTIYFGRGAYGVEAASRAYFGKPVGQLQLAEAAYLAGLIRSPETADANRGPEDPDAAGNVQRATFRRNSVLDAMLQVGTITQAEYDAARATNFETVVPRSTKTNYGRVANPQWGTDYFVDHVRRWLVSEGGFSDADVYGGGLRVYTTLDMADQEAAFDAVTSTLDREGDPAAALVSIDDQGAVRAMLGGLDFATKPVNYALGAEGGGSGRGPGSAFKPFVLAEAVAQGVPLTRTYDAPARLVYPGLGDNGEPWTPGNYSDASQGVLDLVEATAKSSNTAYIQLMEDLGPENVVAMAHRLGITSPMGAHLATVLGTEEVSVLEMAAAFSTFANRGERVEPFVVSKVTDAKGNVLYEHKPVRDRVLSEDQAQQVNWALHQVVEGGTGTDAQYGQPVAGKTGTTDKYRDAWFVGFTCRLTTAVWMGYDEIVDGEPRLMDDVHGIEVTGGSLPTEIWRKYMERATADLDACPFERPPMAREVTPDDTAVDQATDDTMATTTTAPSTTTAPPTTAPTTTAPPTTPPPTTAPPSTPTTQAPQGQDPTTSGP